MAEEIIIKTVLDLTGSEQRLRQQVEKALRSTEAEAKAKEAGRKIGEAFSASIEAMRRSSAFTPVLCPGCNRVLFTISGSPSPLQIRIKCRRCSTKRKSQVYVTLQISLAPSQENEIDLNSENSACA